MVVVHPLGRIAAQTSTPLIPAMCGNGIQTVISKHDRDLGGSRDLQSPSQRSGKLGVAGSLEECPATGEASRATGKACPAK